MSMVVRPEAYKHFASSESNVIIDQPMEISFDVPKQLPKGMTQESVESVAKDAKKGLYAIVVVQILAQFVLKSGMDDMITLYY